MHPDVTVTIPSTLPASGKTATVLIRRRSLNFTTVLPVELSANIFIHCLPLLPSLDTFEHGNLSKILPTLLALGSVCQTWRTIAWSTPELWDTLLIKVQGSQLTPPPSFVEGYLNRSGDLPLTIRLCFDKSTRLTDFGSTIHDVVRLVCSHAKRWRILELSAPFSVIALMKASKDSHPINISCLIIHSFPDMHIEYHRRATFSLGQPIFPSVSRLAVHNINYKNIHINFSHLTHFNAGFITPLDFINILRLAPRMASLSCALSDYPINGEDFPNIASSVAQMPAVHSEHMNSLKFGFNDTRMIVLDLLTFPSLEHFECSNQDFESLRRFFLRSGSRLTRLLLSQDVTNKDMLDLLYLTPSLRELTIEHCALQAGFFQHLWESATQEDDEAAFLPHLRVIHYTTVGLVHPELFQWSNLSTWCLDPLRLAVWTRPLHRLTFESTSLNDFQILFTVQDRAEILRLVESGLDVRILDCDGMDIVASGIF